MNALEFMKFILSNKTVEDLYNEQMIIRKYLTNANYVIKDVPGEGAIISHPRLSIDKMVDELQKIDFYDFLTSDDFLRPVGSSPMIDRLRKAGVKNLKDNELFIFGDLNTSL